MSEEAITKRYQCTCIDHSLSSDSFLYTLKQPSKCWYVYPCIQKQAGGNPYSHPFMQQKTSRIRGSWYVHRLSTFHFSPPMSKMILLYGLINENTMGHLLAGFGYQKEHGSDTSNLVVVCCLSVLAMFS